MKTDCWKDVKKQEEIDRRRKTVILAFPAPVTLQCAWLITNSKKHAWAGFIFSNHSYVWMRFKGCFYAAACGWSMLFLLSCCGSITLVYSLSTLGEGTILHCLWITFGFQSMMYMDGAWDCIVTVSAEKRTASALQTAISPMCSRCFCLLPFILSCPPSRFPSPRSSYFQPFIFYTRGKWGRTKPTYEN